LFGFRAKMDFEEELRRTIAWYKEKCRLQDAKG